MAKPSLRRIVWNVLVLGMVLLVVAPVLSVVLPWLGIFLVVAVTAAFLQDESLRQRAGLWGRLWHIAVFLFFVLVLLAPFRLIAVEVYRHFPPIFAVLNWHLHGAIALFGLQWLPRYDLALGALSAVGVLFLTVSASAWRFTVLNLIDNQVTTTTRGAAMGLHEFKGTVRALPGQKGPVISKRQVLENTGSWRSQESVNPFELEDESGTILVDPRGARLVEPLPSFFGKAKSSFSLLLNSRHEIMLKSSERAMGFPVYELKAGETVYLLGHVTKDERKERVVKPFILEHFRLSFNDAFILTNVSEAEIRKDLKRSIGEGVFLSVILLAMAARLIFLGVKGQGDFLSVYRYLPSSRDFHLSYVDVPENPPHERIMAEKELWNWVQEGPKARAEVAWRALHSAGKTGRMGEVFGRALGETGDYAHLEWIRDQVRANYPLRLYDREISPTFVAAGNMVLDFESCAAEATKKGIFLTYKVFAGERFFGENGPTVTVWAKMGDLDWQSLFPPIPLERGWNEKRDLNLPLPIYYNDFGTHQTYAIALKIENQTPQPAIARTCSLTLRP